jgi:hypothetical protein
VKNDFAGKLTATRQLVVSGEKKIRLDYETAPKPVYMQIFEDASGVRTLTFLNTHKNAIYFYDYENGTYISNTRFEREGPNAILRLAGYYVKNMDSIYVYNMPKLEIVLSDSAGSVKQRISLWKGNAERPDAAWALYYPQYLFNTVTPLSCATLSTPLGEKPVIVIIMDEQFNYLGETLIGTGKQWNWENSFVTEDGLNIEYIDDNDTEEEYLNLKIFTVEEL